MFLSIGIAVYNEEKNIEKCLRSLKGAIVGFNYKLYLCFNGCTDASELVIKQFLQKENIMHYQLLYSEKGKVIAQNAIIDEIDRTGHLGDPIVFIDADIELHPGCIRNLYNELFRVNELLIVGALTKPVPRKHKNLWYYVLNIRNLYPLSEVAKYDVQEYKWYCTRYPQRGISQENEMKNKIYFHGRCFMLKYARLYQVPLTEKVADDTYLANNIHYNFGPGVIRNIFSAVVYYSAYDDPLTHWKTYWRIYNDKIYIDEIYQQFCEIRKKEKTVLNAEYIATLPIRIQLCFCVYRGFIKIEKLSYQILPQTSIEKIWLYREK
jgi:glycosyltransferase involved in cell wall biosynthesis